MVFGVVSGHNKKKQVSTLEAHASLSALLGASSQLNSKHVSDILRFMDSNFDGFIEEEEFKVSIGIDKKGDALD
jgi:Ca2+-binding EF-hand superfamily protein